MRIFATTTGAILAAFVLAASITALAEEREGGQSTALMRELRRAPLPLERGLAASSSEGIPISAKYELEDDDADELQLSVYTMQSGAADVDSMTGDVTLTDAMFFEVIVDYASGKIGKVVPIRDGEDLAAAKIQSKAMAQAKRSLEAAIVQALRANHGYRAVSAIPDLKDGHPVARVILINGADWKTVVETLD